MSRGYRIITTCLIAIGGSFLGFYFLMQNENHKFMMLEKPSYYILQNYWYVFLAGIIVLFFSVLGSFFSWFHAMEEREKILPNAGYSNQEEITDWVGGTSLDTRQLGGMKETAGGEERTELLTNDEQTELLANDEQTELLANDEQTELLANDEQTELLANGEQTELLANGEQTELLASDEQTELLANDEHTELLEEQTQEING